MFMFILFSGEGLETTTLWRAHIRSVLRKTGTVDTVGEKRSFSWQRPLLNTLPL